MTTNHPDLRIFDDRQRTDWSPADPGESLYSFLDQSADPYFAAVRTLLDDWLSRVPPEHRPGLVGDFKADKDKAGFTSAFWELYLHELYLSRGYTVEIHPVLAHTGKHPDFLVEGHGDRFYLEAVQVGTAPPELAEARRLDDVHRVLDTETTGRFSLSLSYAAVGPNPLATTRLRKALRKWLGGLDPDAVAAALHAPEVPGELAFDRMPLLTWKDGGWDLHFHAIPLKPGLPAGSTPMIGMHGPGAAQMIDKHTGLLRALDSKANKYGALDAPLVIAVLDNTGPIGTHGYDIEQALYGLAPSRPAASPAPPPNMIREGHWLTRAGWRRGHAPQVVTAVQFNPWNVADHRPLLWETLEPGVAAPRSQPDFLATVDVSGPDPTPLPAGPNPFGLAPGWPGPGRNFR